MNSVVETFPQACINGTDAAKEEFVSQLDGILAGIRTSQARLEERKSELEYKLGLLRDERRRLADAHRTYLKTIKLFQEECKKNEKLIAALTQNEAPE
jgi:DNA repair exonuclease SbcCD ATPase subunit